MVGDQFSRVTVEMTPVADSPLNRREPVLPALNPRVVRKAVFGEEQLSSGAHDPVQFVKYPTNVWDAAKRKRANHAVEPSIIKRKVFSPNLVMFHLNGCPMETAPRDSVHAGIGVDRRDVPDFRGIVREIEPRAESHLKHVTFDVGQQFRTNAPKFAPGEREIHECGKDST